MVDIKIMVNTEINRINRKIIIKMEGIINIMVNRVDTERVENKIIIITMILIII
jgi:hypothetical protein